ncbi:hypothetical protein CsSME_00019695 [Camellia sinensis var. sinensis]
MQKSGLMPDQFTFGSIIRSCSSLKWSELGRQLHVHVIKSEFGSHVIAQNALIAMYTKFGQITDALDVFSGIKKKDFISWNAIIAGFAYGGDADKAMLFFSQMNTVPTNRIYLSTQLRPSVKTCKNGSKYVNTHLEHRTASVPRPKNRKQHNANLTYTEKHLF